MGNDNTRRGGCSSTSIVETALARGPTARAPVIDIVGRRRGGRLGPHIRGRRGRGRRIDGLGAALRAQGERPIRAHLRARGQRRAPVLVR
jgi:hypothetical protein